VNIPVLKFLNENFTSGTGSEVLNRYSPNTTSGSISFRSSQFFQTVVQTLQPEMTIEVPTYVRSYFFTPETIEFPVSAFSDVSMAVYPETSQTNLQGIIVGYGDSTSTNASGLYGVYPSTSYEGHIPIHIKRSRSLLVVENNEIRGTNLSLDDFLSNLFPRRPPGCLTGAVVQFLDAPDFLANGQSYLNVVSLSKSIRRICPPSFLLEDCNNGIDDDGDGLIDGDDPDCVLAAKEICDNGIDDDNDGLIDGDDPDCELQCPEDAVYYRDCEENTNRITGGAFASVNWYTNIINPFLPALESQINLTFNIFRILNIANCNSPCPLNREFTNVTKDATSVFLHPDLLSNPYLLSSPIVWRDSYEYFEDDYSTSLTDVDVSYFLIRAQLENQDVPPGSVRIGSIGGGGEIVGQVQPGILLYEFAAYVITANWVNYASPFTDDLVVNNGIDYTRNGNTGPDWDASQIGDYVQIDIDQTDFSTLSVQDGTSNTTSDSRTRSVSLSGSVGQTFGISAGSGGGPTNSNPQTAGFTFGQSSTVGSSASATLQYTITSERIIPLSTITLKYQDTADKQKYPKITAPSIYIIQSQFHGLGPDVSYGHNPDAQSTWERNPFSLSTTTFDPTDDNPYQMLNEDGPIRLINVIKKAN
jgi:hypothetical protein